MLNYNPTPVTEFKNELTVEFRLRIIVKREDENHSSISGNKWWKLKYNLEEAQQQGFKKIITFGGAYSNHIYATAAAANEYNFESLGIIRGERVEPLNSTLRFAEEQGMKLHFISREEYRKKTTAPFLVAVQEQLGNAYVIPEGGSNTLAVKGCAELAEKHLTSLDFDYVILPVGTGGTMAGLICGLKGEKKIIGVSVLKGGTFLINDIKSFVENYCGKDYGNWELLTSYDHGGYAKVTDALRKFIVMMNEQHNLPLDPVYTGKMMFALMEEIKQGKFKSGSTILVLHTGGLQGAASLMREA